MPSIRNSKKPVSLSRRLEGQQGLTQEALRSVIETQLSALSREFIEDIKGVSRTVMDSLADQGREIENVLRAQRGYNGYIDAVWRFGFGSVWGGQNLEGGSSDILYQHAKSISINSTVRYLNTFVRDIDNFVPAVDKLVSKGVHMKVLVMHPDKDAAVVEARHHDLADVEPISLDEFIERVAHTAKRLVGLRAHLNRRRKRNGLIGTFDVCFYRKSLNFPMLMLNRFIDGRAEEVAFTGFYSRESAEKMPFIEWRREGGGTEGTEEKQTREDGGGADGEKAPIDVFRAMFDAKFKECKEGGFDEVRSITRFPFASSEEINKLLHSAYEMFEYGGKDSRRSAVLALLDIWESSGFDGPMIEAHITRVVGGAAVHRRGLESDIEFLQALASAPNSQLRKIGDEFAHYAFNRIWFALRGLLAEPASALKR